MFLRLVEILTSWQTLLNDGNVSVNVVSSSECEIRDHSDADHSDALE